MADPQTPLKYNDTEDGESAPRSIEEALEMTLKSALTRGVSELREFFDGSISDNTITTALTDNDLNIEKTVLYLQELSDFSHDSPRPEAVANPAEPEELESVDSGLFERGGEVVVQGEEGMTGIALDFSCSPMAQRPPMVKVYFISDDILRVILTCLSGKEAIALSRVCKSWCNVEKQSSSLYRRECHSLWSLPLVRPDNVDFPFPFNSTEALWGKGYPEEFLAGREYLKGFRTWRNMFVARPRVGVDGVYVSKTKYLRAGATEGAYVNPMHEVVYFRYFRFYPDHSLLCVTTSERPSKVLPILSPDYPSVRLGEWAARENELVAHAIEGNNVYSYCFRMTESRWGKHDLLRLKECSVRSSVNVTPLRMDTAGNSFPRFFRFFKN